MPKQAPTPDPIDDPNGVFDLIMSLSNASPPNWRALAKVLKDLGWELDRSGQLPDVLAHKQFRPGPGVTAYMPQAIWMELGFSIGFTAAANIIHARQGAASTLIAPPSDPAGN